MDAFAERLDVWLAVPVEDGVMARSVPDAVAVTAATEPDTDGDGVDEAVADEQPVTDDVVDSEKDVVGVLEISGETEPDGDPVCVADTDDDADSEREPPGERLTDAESVIDGVARGDVDADGEAVSERDTPGVPDTDADSVIVAETVGDDELRTEKDDEPLKVGEPDSDGDGVGEKVALADAVALFVPVEHGEGDPERERRPVSVCVGDAQKVPDGEPLGEAVGDGDGEADGEPDDDGDGEPLRDAELHTVVVADAVSPCEADGADEPEGESVPLTHAVTVASN